MKLSAMISHQLSIIGAGQKFARLKLLTSAELFRNQLSFLCHQRIPTVLCREVSLNLRDQSLDLVLDDDKLRGVLQLMLFSNR